MLSLTEPQAGTATPPASKPGSEGYQSGWYPRGGKRSFDLVAGLLILLLLAPLLLALCLTSRILLGRAVFFTQQRIGRNGTAFSCVKFRTMSTDRRTGDRTIEHPDRRLQHKSVADPRHTKYGRLLRKYSLDELPQLFNLIRGDMSLVGPRPEMSCVASERFRSHERHELRPGLTGLFQLSELRSAGSLEEGLHLDEEYLQQVSLRTDVRCLARTAAVVIRGTGN